MSVQPGQFVSNSSFFTFSSGADRFAGLEWHSRLVGRRVLLLQSKIKAKNHAHLCAGYVWRRKVGHKSNAAKNVYSHSCTKWMKSCLSTAQKQGRESVKSWEATNAVKSLSIAKWSLFLWWCLQLSRNASKSGSRRQQPMRPKSCHKGTIYWHIWQQQLQTDIAFLCSFKFWPCPQIMATDILLLLLW